MPFYIIIIPKLFLNLETRGKKKDKKRRNLLSIRNLTTSLDSFLITRKKMTSRQKYFEEMYFFFFTLNLFN